MKHLITLLLLAALPVPGTAQSTSNPLTLEQAVSSAIDGDPWLNGSHLRETALANESASVATLPDPKVSLSAANFPTDSFDINQEAMTQLVVGVTQMFPRGDSLDLSRRQKQVLASQEPLLRTDRKAKVTATVTQLWLEAFKAQESIRLIEHDRSLFEHLVDATRASYSSALGRARQQDIIRAQLELTRLEDRLYTLHQHRESAQQQLAEWLGSAALQPLDAQLPSLAAPPLSLVDSASEVPQQRYQQISRHPALLALDQRIEAMQTGVELARQKYKPEWGLAAQYGYRDDDPTGRDRADLFSIGVSFDLPLFTGNRQDKEVSAANANAESMKTDKLLMARRMLSQLQTSWVRLQRLDERGALYDQQLLPQMAEQAEAALTAYNNDDGDFAEAVRARIAELNAKIAALGIAVERQQTLAQLQYLLTASDNQADTDAEDAVLETSGFE